MSDPLKAPFPWFGGKSRVVPLVWERFGDVGNYVEPFFGSGAVLLGRPTPGKIETVNDLDGFVANAWRAIAQAPAEVAGWADWPVNECDLHARHVWLKARRTALSERLNGDPDYYDVKIAGWWLWGMALWIGSGFCGENGAGPWVVEDGRFVKREKTPDGVWRKLPHLGDAGRGVSRRLPHLGDAGQGVSRRLPHLGDAGQGVARVTLSDAGQGVSRQRPHLSGAGQGVTSQTPLYDWMDALADRMRRVRVCCGDWSRIMGDSPTIHNGTTGVFFDPPYLETTGRDMGIYIEDSSDVAHAVREWAIEHGDDPLLRIALCGYAGEHDMPSGWRAETWKAQGGYAGQRLDGVNVNATRETIWFSPHCLQPMPTLFDFARTEEESWNAIRS